MRVAAPGIFPGLGDWGARRPGDVGFAPTGAERRPDPNKPQKGVDDNRRTACQFVKDSSYKERGEEEW